MRRNRPTILIRRHLQDSLQDLQDFVSHLRRGDASPEILRPVLETTGRFVIEHTPDRGLDGPGWLIQPHGVPQQQGRTEDGSDRVGNTLPSDIGGRTVDRLIQAGRRFEVGSAEIGNRRCAGERS